MSVQTGLCIEEEGSQLNPHQAEENLPVRRQELLCSAISNHGLQRCTLSSIESESDTGRIAVR